MNSNGAVYLFCVGRSELDIFIMVHWWKHFLEKKQNKNIPILQELQVNCFFFSQTREGVVER